MQSQELIKVCHYFKGESSSPFESKEANMFWNIERQWVHNCLRSNGFKSIWENKARGLMEKSKPSKVLFNNLSLSNEEKGLIIYIQEMLSKWAPEKANLIYSYL